VFPTTFLYIVSFMETRSQEAVEAIKSKFQSLIHPVKDHHAPSIVPKNSLTDLERIDDSSSPSSVQSMSPIQKQLRERDIHISRETVDKWMRASFKQPKP
jgi:hypothetical protein